MKSKIKRETHQQYQSACPLIPSTILNQKNSAAASTLEKIWIPSQNLLILTGEVEKRMLRLVLSWEPILQSIYYLMQKSSSELRNLKRDSKIRFNLSAGNLACFKSQAVLPRPKVERKELKLEALLQQNQIKCLSNQLPEQPIRPRIAKTPNEGQTSKRRASFNERVVFMYYDDEDVYIDSSTCKKSDSVKTISPKHQGLASDSPHQDEDDFLEKCVRVITQQTDTSNPLSYTFTPPSLTSRSNEIYQPLSYNPNKTVRNRRSVTQEESKNFVIDYENIERDGRTTIMIKNIPNKYSQEMLLEQFCVNHEKKFDFFYLPIDKDNNCNVGYAFVNFIEPSYLKSFYEEFHLKKWRRYRSPKICNISYARYQGTLELANHFRNTKILHQKDRKLRPLIGLTEANRIEEIVRSQQLRQE